VDGRLVGYNVSSLVDETERPTFRLSIARMARPSAGEYCAGIGGILPDLTRVMSSAWVVADENGDLRHQDLPARRGRIRLTQEYTSRRLDSPDSKCRT